MTDFNPATYWDRRYREGRDSGEGSRGATGLAKAQRVNREIEMRNITSLADWGCGDGQVLRHLTPHVNYVGIDVSQTIIDRLKPEFPEREFVHVSEADDIEAEMSLSMDVIFHFPNDDDYRSYLSRVFNSATQVVLIYSTNYDGGRTARHVRRRQFTNDVMQLCPWWKLVDDPGNDTVAGFYTYIWTGTR